jgi:hypothetical protein
MPITFSHEAGGIMNYCKRFLVILIVVSSPLWAYENLRVLDPEATWRNSRGNIDSATISVKPQGIYAEVGLYLHLSARDWGYGQDDQLEIELDFTLPEDAIVIDSWLWVEGKIIRGELMDKWTAAEIYEDIVDRRRDPSILYKHYDNQYELRIYPLIADSYRKVKITYLVPMQWHANEVTIPLPDNILAESRYEIPETSLIFWPEGAWQRPRLNNGGEDFFRLVSGGNGNYWLGKAAFAAIVDDPSIALPNPMVGGIYLSTYADADAGFYQLAFLPMVALDIATAEKVVLLFDYEANKSATSPEQLLAAARQMMLSQVGNLRAFNLMFAHLQVEQAADHYLKADSATIDSVFNTLDSETISRYSNLASLLAAGVEFANQQGTASKILLLSNSDNYPDNNSANPLIDDLMDLMDPVVPVTIADFHDRNVNWSYIGGSYYQGNEYFYLNLTRSTGAEYFNIRNGQATDLTALLEQAVASIGEPITAFDMHTTVAGGYCYSRLHFGLSGAFVNPQTAILQTGKYNGAMPFSIEVSGAYRGDVFSREIEFPETLVEPGDSLIRAGWYGQYLEQLEDDQQANDVVAEIVDVSLDERLLSIYTAFLCLEPERGGEVCYDCFDESDMTPVDDDDQLPADSLEINAYPNPFNNAVQITVTLSRTVDLSDADYAIYNTLGQVVRRFSPGSLANNRINLSWDGTNEQSATVASGTYFFVIRTPGKRYMHKLLLLK